MKRGILDFFGRKIADHETSADGAKIDLSGLNAGIYFLKISSGDDVHVHKIIRN